MMTANDFLVTFDSAFPAFQTPSNVLGNESGHFKQKLCVMWLCWCALKKQNGPKHVYTTFNYAHSNED